MALKDAISLGMSLPHRSLDRIDEPVVRQVASAGRGARVQRSLGHEQHPRPGRLFDALTVLTYAAALTTTIRLGVSVMVLPIYHPIHVAHQVATLDHLSSGRAILGVGLGRDEEYVPFQVPSARRVRRFTESVALMKALWAGYT